MCGRPHKKNKMMTRPPMPLEELGLLCLLEKVGGLDDDMDAYARHGLLQQGFITGGTIPTLTKKGVARLQELRAWREEGGVGSRVRGDATGSGGGVR